MFEEIYRAANDDIRVSSELLEKTLKLKRRKRLPIYKYASAAAAVFIAFAAVTAVPLMNMDNSGVMYRETVESTAEPPTYDESGNPTEDIETAAENTAEQANTASSDSANTQSAEVSSVETQRTDDGDSSRAEAANGGNSSQTENVNSGNLPQTDETRYSSESDSNSGSTASVSAARESAGIYSHAGVYSSTVHESSERQSDGYIQNANDLAGGIEEADESVSDEGGLVEGDSQKKVNTYTKSVVLHVNSEDYGGAASESEDYGDYDGSGEYTAAEWSMEDYFEYLGENVFDKVSLSDDFEYIGEYDMTVSVDENGEPLLDSRIFPYSGADGRYLTVITSRNTLAAQAYLSDDRYAKSDINGNSAVVIGGGGSYKCYIIGNGISYIITSRGMDEEEFTELLVSISGS